MVSRQTTTRIALLSVLLLASCGREPPSAPRAYHLTGHVVLTGFLVDESGLFAGTRVVGNADGVLVELTSAGRVVAQTASVNGVYQFSGLLPGSYIARAPVIGDFFDETEPLRIVSGDLAVADTLRLISRGDLLPAPNPSDSSTTIYFELAAAESVQVRILDMGGRTVRALLDGALPRGPNQVLWDGLDDHDQPATDALYWATLVGPAQTRAQLLFR